MKIKGRCYVCSKTAWVRILWRNPNRTFVGICEPCELRRVRR